MRPSTDEPLLQQSGGGGAPCDAKAIVVTAALAVAELGLCLLVGWGIKAAYYDAAQCSAGGRTSCTFAAGKAAGGRHMAILSAASVDSQAGCCNACVRFEGCVAATYIHTKNSTTAASSDSGWLANCLMYSSDVFTAGDEISRPDAALCTPPDASRLISGAEKQPQFLLSFAFESFFLRLSRVSAWQVAVFHL